MKNKNDNLRIAILRGDRVAIQQVEMFLGPIINSEVVNSEERNDLRQHCLVEIVEYLRRRDDIRNIWQLIRRITINSAIDFNRRRRRSNTIVLHTEDGSSPEMGADTGAPLRDALDNLVVEDEIRYVLNSIGEKCRRILKMLFVDGLSYAETSSELGITEGNLRVSLSRCRNRAIALRDRSTGAQR